METAPITIFNRRQFDRLMLKHNNDNERVLQILRERQEKRAAKKLLLVQSEQQFQPLLQTLANAGYSKVKVNVRLLLRFEGEIEPVMTVLAKREEKRLNRDLKRKLSINKVDDEKNEAKRVRKEERLARKAEKFARKQEKFARKQENEKNRDNKEERKREHRASRNRNSENEAGEKAFDPPVDWNNVQHLYLDGNNMMFVPAELRNLVLKRNSRAAERKLAAISRAFALRQGIAKTTLLFDNTPLHEEDETFTLKSSRPTFATSDDELVSFAQSSQGEHCVFVTSDRELRERLSAFGVTLMKPGRWFEAVDQLLGEEYREILGRQL